MATMRERVLVTGASGFVGGHCVTELIAHGYEVRVAVRNPAGVQHLAGVSEVVRADLESDSGWADAAAGCDYVLHVASPLPLSTPADENDVIRPAAHRNAYGSGQVGTRYLADRIFAMSRSQTCGPAQIYLLPAAWGVSMASRCATARSRTSTVAQPRRGTPGTSLASRRRTGSREVLTAACWTGPRTSPGRMTVSSIAPSARAKSHAARSARILLFM